MGQEKENNTTDKPTKPSVEFDLDGLFDDDAEPESNGMGDK